MNKVDDYLKHYGILGMKWGVRKGSSKRIAKAKAKAKQLVKGSDDYERSRSLKKKRLADMSNKEIEDLTRRLQLETNYRRLNPIKKSRGRRFLESSLKVVGEQAVSEFNKQFIKPRVERAMSDLIKKAARRSAG